MRPAPGGLLLGLVLLSGCLSGLDQSEGPHRGNLSEAMRTSAEGGGQISSHDSHGADANADDSSTGIVPAAFAAADSSGSQGLIQYKDTDFWWQIPVDVGYAIPLNGDISGITRFSLTPISTESELGYIGLFVSGDLVNLKPGSLADDGAVDPGMAEMGLSLRRYFNGSHTFLSPYISGSLACQILFWDYRHPLYDGTTEIRSDSLFGAGGYLGAGVAIMRKEFIGFYAEAGVGGTVFADRTTQGFYNDVFDNYGYVQVSAGVCIKF